MKKTVLTLIIVISSFAWAEVGPPYELETIETWTGETESWFNLSTNVCIAQSFVVPGGRELHSLDIYIHDSRQVVDDGYKLAIALYQNSYGASDNLVEVVSVPQADIPDAGWVTLEITDSNDMPASVASGSYYVQVWSNNATYNSQLWGRLVSNSSYENGSAAVYWSGGTLLEEDQDFKVQLNTAIASPGVIDTYTDSGDSSWHKLDNDPDSKNALLQTFEVSPRQELTKVEFRIADTGVMSPTYSANIAVFSIDEEDNTELVQYRTVPSTDIVDGGWIEMALDNPVPAGKYLMEVWSNQPFYHEKLHGRLYSGSDYSYGRAYDNWYGDPSLLTKEQDFATRITTQEAAAYCGDGYTLFLNGDIAGPDGVGSEFRDCTVNIYDLAAMSSDWLECTDPTDPSCELAR